MLTDYVSEGNCRFFAFFFFDTDIGKITVIMLDTFKKNICNSISKYRYPQSLALGVNKISIYLKGSFSTIF